MSLKFLICFFSAWMITNGWSYIFVVLGPTLKIDWMTKVGVSYQTFLWLPCTPEKLVTIPLAAFFNFLLFKDRKTQEALDKMKQQAVEDWQKLWRKKMNDKELIALIMMVYSKDTPPEFKEYLTRLKFFKNGRPTKKLARFIAKYKLPLIVDV